MVDKDHPSLSISEQCRLLSISRSSFYYELLPAGPRIQGMQLLMREEQMIWHGGYFPRRL